jgi:hypothetical protein
MCVVDGIENGACSSSAGTHTSYATAGFTFASTLATKTLVVGGEIKTPYETHHIFPFKQKKSLGSISFE